MSIIINKFQLSSDLKSIEVDIQSDDVADDLSKFHIYVNDGFTSGSYTDLSSKITDGQHDIFTVTATDLGLTSGEVLYGIYIGYVESVNALSEYASTANLLKQRLCLLDKTYKLSNNTATCGTSAAGSGNSKDDINTVYLLLEGLQYALISKEYTIALDFYNKLLIMCDTCDSCEMYVVETGCVYGVGTMAINGCFIVF